MELAWRLWGVRRRRHAQLRDLAWAVSLLASIQVSQGDQSKVSMDRLFTQVTGADLDEDEVLR